MKAYKILLKSTIAAAIFAVAVSCDGVTNPEPIPVIDTTRTATIVGTAYANLNESNDTTGVTEQDYERAPENTTVTVVLNARDFSNSAAPDQKLTYNTKTDGAGNFVIEVPALFQVINGEVFMSSFTASQTKTDGTQQEEIFSANPAPVSITANSTASVNITYTEG